LRLRLFSSSCPLPTTRDLRQQRKRATTLPPTDHLRPATPTPLRLPPKLALRRLRKPTISKLRRLLQPLYQASRRDEVFQFLLRRRLRCWSVLQTGSLLQTGFSPCTFLLPDRVLQRVRRLRLQYGSGRRSSTGISLHVPASNLPLRHRGFWKFYQQFRPVGWSKFPGISTLSKSQQSCTSSMV
jgi:hypothetical protein